MKKILAMLLTFCLIFTGAMACGCCENTYGYTPSPCIKMLYHSEPAIEFNLVDEFCWADGWPDYFGEQIESYLDEIYEGDLYWIEECLDLIFCEEEYDLVTWWFPAAYEPDFDLIVAILVDHEINPRVYIRVGVINEDGSVTFDFSKFPDRTENYTMYLFNRAYED